ncbi:dihydropteroate synthase [Alteribacillus sp. HJP-4]|uniref:dihydropteroate synthase n=1 Tax=Alteribacillus sp. HJP-4 TaxID=2775394 RepID=UPI0035CD0475
MNSEVMSWGSRILDFSKKTYVMGILNATPDSFSDGGRYVQLEEALKHAKEMVRAGADIIDIGGESTRPGAVEVDLKEELRRVVPVIKELAKQVEVPISIDTYKAETAKQAIEAGASIINDVWGAKADPEMAHVAAAFDVPIILMHNRENTEYGDLMTDMINDMKESIAICHAAGVKNNRIILDPGIGFAKTYEQNLEAMRRLEEFTSLGYPVLLGTSRKSIVAKTLDLPVNDRLEGTGATVSLGIERGCSIVRVHDVLEMSRTVKMMDAMLGKGKVKTVG